VIREILGVEGSPHDGPEQFARDMIKDYLKAMDWGLAGTRPSQAKLQRLGLKDVAKDLYR
jgi:hypothetical protein